MCKVDEIEGKGRGLVLARAVEPGSLLVQEQALMVLARDQVGTGDGGGDGYNDGRLTVKSQGD